MIRTLATSAAVLGVSLALYIQFPAIEPHSSSSEIVGSFLLCQTFAALGLVTAIIVQLARHKLDERDIVLGPLRGVGVFLFWLALYAALTIVERMDSDQPISWRSPMLCLAMLYGDWQLIRVLGQVHKVARRVPVTVAATVTHSTDHP